MIPQDDYRAIREGAQLGPLCRAGRSPWRGRMSHMQGLLTNDIPAPTPGTATGG
jgi:hypothetical protein